MDMQENQRLPSVKKKYYSKTKNPEETYLNSVFKQQRYDSDEKHRNIFWDLTYDEWKSVITQNCYTCGTEPEMRQGKFHSKHGKQVPINGLDRVDNLKGYTITNVKPCCSRCNYMKHRMTHDIFLEHVNKIWSFQCQHTNS
jgi:hypothetical protein